MTQRHRRDRKKKRLLYGAAAAVVATATIGTIAVASPGLLGAPGTAAPGSASTLQEQFASAAREFDVPQSVLMAVSYRQTWWESHDGQPSTTGAYNVMGLTKVDPEDVEEPTDKEWLAHLNASDSPEISKKFDAAKALRKKPEKPVDTDDPRLHTLDKAAGLIGSSTEVVQNDTATSIRAGAALLAEYQKQAGLEASDDAGDWYPAVARYSQSPDKKGADLFAKRVFDSIRTGEQALTTEGEYVSLPADPSVTPVKPANVPLAATFASTTGTTATAECPSGLGCDFVAAVDPSNGVKNYSLANRSGDPNGFQIRQIVIHDTESSYGSALDTFRDSSEGVSTHYLIRSSDGHVTQMVENKDVAWHAGNWTLNMHSIGVEHEGIAIQGNWYTVPMYESSAALVKFLATQYKIPLDREHIIGHDEIPGTLNSKVSGMHWDAGPFWDWNRYMALMGAPTGDQRAGGLLQKGQIVRVVPPFTSANQPKLTYDGAAVAARPANFGYLYATASTATPISDPYLPSGWSPNEAANWGSKVRAGGSYVVSRSTTNWTAIWYGGREAWFYNPGGQYTSVVGGTAAKVVKVKAGATARLYGRSFPEASAYTGTGQTAPTDNPDHLSTYVFPEGQAYVKAGDAVKGDDYFGSAQTRVVGNESYVPIRYNHRLAWVKQTDVVEASPEPAVTATDRNNVIARDKDGVLWQYQGSGSGSAPFLTKYRVGPGWQVYNAITPMTTLRADGVGDLVARDKDGVLWYYKGTGNPSVPFKTRLKVGGGWNAYSKLLGVGDMNADGRPDLIARDTTGVLWMYKNTGASPNPFATRVRVGGGWNTYNELIATGDLDKDGRPDLIARDTTGALWMYKNTGASPNPYATRAKVGGGWGVYNVMVG
ncbi:N-acetylmuramoyl-L-alanine amidase, partial [Streptomyces filamentosus]